MKKIIFIFFTSFMLTACLDEFKIPDQNAIQKLVVEGGISNISEEFFLRLSYSDEVGVIRRILPSSGLYVEIRSKSGEKFVLRADPLGSGQFKPESGKIEGKVGESYALYASFADGREYESQFQKMLEPVPVTEILSKSQKSPSPGYKFSVNLNDPAASENYYRWKAQGYHIRRSVGIKVGFGDNYCCNVCWVKEINEGINILSDANFNGNKISDIPVFSSPYFGPGKQVVLVYQYSINKEAYSFYQKYRSQLNRTGSIFDPLPAGVRGNVINSKDITDLALGFFEVSALSKKQIIIENDDLKDFNINYSSDLYVPPGDCMLKYPFSIYFDGTLPKF